ncbi:DUF937 domain-containing protein [uncultured Methylobacterium sp.]|uniref:DUF937 domain-containing protein n=1 Tax=uncultured Methylobacterium sp. TaxID=157278 RepID=UPI0035CC0314
MFNLFDILQAQGGAGLQGVGQQYGLSPEQTRKAMEALLPAFSLGLQRNALADPTGFGQLFGLVGTNGAGRPAPPSQPELLVQQIFGSPHLSQAVIQQASAASGIATPIMRQMMPMVAGMVVAGIVHLMLNQNQAAPAPPPQAPAAGPFGFAPTAAYWADMMKNWAAASVPTAPPDRAAPRRAAASLASQPSKGPGPAMSATAPYEMVQQMFQAGVDAQQENVKAMQTLFDAFWTRPSSTS